MEEEYMMNKTMGERVLEGFQFYYTPILVGLGTLGNSLSVLVFFGTKLRNLSSSYYLSALAVSDTGFLITDFVTWLALIDVPLFHQPGFCQLTIYFSQVWSFLSVWFIVAFTVERFIAVRYPLRRPSMCTVTRAKLVLAVLSLLALTGHIPYLVMSAPQLKQAISHNSTTEVLVCDVVKDWENVAKNLNHVDFVITLLVPFCVIVVLNVLISRTVWRVSRVRRSMTQMGKCSTTANRATSRRGGASSSQTKVTEMLLLVSTVFICLNLPSYVIRVWVYVYKNSLAPEAEKQLILIQHYFNLLFNTNYGINFALYCVSGQNFRRALVNLFCPGLRHRRTDNTQITGLGGVDSNFSNTSSRREKQSPTWEYSF